MLTLKFIKNFVSEKCWWFARKDQYTIENKFSVSVYAIFRKMPFEKSKKIVSQLAISPYSDQ